MRQSAALPDATIWREASLAWFHFTTCIPSLISKSFFIFSFKPLIIQSFALANSESIGTPLFQVSRTALLVAPSKRYDQGNLYMKGRLSLGTHVALKFHERSFFSVSIFLAFLQPREESLAEVMINRNI